MPTTVTVTVDDGSNLGSPDYSSLSAAEAGEQRDLVAADEIAEFECYAFEEDTGSGEVTFNGWTTDATHYPRVYTPSNQRHDGTPGTGYRLKSSSGEALNVDVSAFRMFGVAIDQVDSGSSAPRCVTIASGGDGEIHFAYNWFRGPGPTSPAIQDKAEVASATRRVWNNIACHVGNFWAQSGVGTDNEVYCYNNTVYDVGTAFKCSGSASNKVAKNNIIQEADTNFDGSWNLTSNVTDGSVSFADAANDDFHLASGDTGAQDQGVDLSSDADLAFSDDIDGDSRPQGSAWDIGADEFVSQVASLSANPLSQSQSLASSSLSQIHGLSADPLSQAQALAEATLGSAVSLAVNALTQSQSLDSATLGQTHSLDSDPLDQTQSLAQAALDQLHNLTPNELGQVQSLDQAPLAQAHALSTNALAQAQTISSPSLAQDHTLTPNALSHVQALEEALIGTAAYTLTPNDLAQTQALASVSITEIVQLLANALSQAQSLGQAALSQVHNLSSDSLSQTQDVEEVTLRQDHTLTPNALSHSQAVEQITLRQTHSLTTNPLSHSQSIGTVSVSQIHVLDTDDVSQVQAVEAVTLRQQHTLTPDNITQVQALADAGLIGESVDLGPPYTLAITDRNRTLVVTTRDRTLDMES